ncbi:MAG: protein kinase [Planctomycetaceae bacterium]
MKERLGEGGMGVVYRARYVVKDIDVAVKMLPDDVTNPVVLARFEREVELLKSLQHPNIVRSFGGVCEDKRRFYAMELMSGGSLEDMLQERGKLPWELVIEYGKQMCAALDYLHKNGVIHRDLKPANFLIDQQGTLKLSDFGLASVLASRRITTAGKTAGTLLYMAPEQIRGGDITPQTDLYALGCVLFELLTGKPPYVGETPAATMHMHCRADVPRITPLALDCPAALEQLVMQLLAKEPADRPTDALTVARQLGLVTSRVTVVSKPRPIDSDSFKRSPSSSRSTEESQYKETRDLERVVSGRASKWPLLLSLLCIAGLLVWGFGLQETAAKAARAEELWVEALQSEHALVQVNALQSLGKLPNLKEPSIDAVTEVLEDTNQAPEVRIAAARSLGAMGHQARTVTPMLHRLWNQEPDQELRAQSHDAIQRIQSDQGTTRHRWLMILCVIAVLAVGGYVWWHNYGDTLLQESRRPHGS